MDNSTSTPAATSEKAPPLPRLVVDDGVTTLRQTAARLGNPYALTIVDANDAEDTRIVAVLPIPSGNRKAVERVAARLSAAGDLLLAAKDAAVRLREFVRDRIPSPSVEDLVEIHALEEAIRKAEGRAG